MKTVILNYLKNRLEEKTTWIGILTIITWFGSEYLGINIPINEILGENSNIPLNEIILGVGGALFGIPSNVMVALGNVIKK